MMGLSALWLADAASNFSDDMSGATFWMPTQASDFAAKVDSLWDFILWVSIFFFVLLMVLTVRFAWKYRQRSPTQRTSPAKHHFKLEFLWSAVPTVILVVIFAWGFSDYTALSATPSNALNVRAVGKQWAWTISYPQLDRECTPTLDPDTGTQTTTFYLPVNQPFTVQLSSDDVVHSFWIPAFRAKKDVLPNRYTGFTVTPTEPGEYNLYCAEYCGTNHSRMQGKVEVLTEEEWAEFLLKSDPRCVIDSNAPNYGEKLFAKYGCAGCHSVAEGRPTVVGPGLYGIVGHEVETDQGTVIADDDYLRESIVFAGKRIVKGFETVKMPSFEGRLSEKELGAIIDYIKGLGKTDHGPTNTNE